MQPWETFDILHKKTYEAYMTWQHAKIRSLGFEPGKGFPSWVALAVSIGAWQKETNNPNWEVLMPR